MEFYVDNLLIRFSQFCLHKVVERGVLLYSLLMIVGGEFSYLLMFFNVHRRCLEF